MSNLIDYNHTGFEQLSPEAIALTLREGLGLRVEEMSRVDIGHVNQSFFLKAGDRKLFCKISPLWYRRSLSREKWCIDRLRSQGLAVPEVIGLIGEDNRGVPGHAILVLEYIEGEMVSHLPGISETVWEKIGAIYHEIHSFPMEGFGWLDDSFVGQKETWLDFLLDIENLDLCRSISPSMVTAVDRLLAEFRRVDFSALTRGSLLYGDFNLDNFILSPSGQVYALDFQNCFSGDPLYDFPLAIDRYPSYVNLIGRLDSGQERLLELYTLRYLLTRISYFYQKGQGQADHYLQRFWIVFEKIKRSDE